MTTSGEMYAIHTNELSKPFFLVLKTIVTILGLKLSQNVTKLQIVRSSISTTSQGQIQFKNVLFCVRFGSFKRERNFAVFESAKLLASIIRNFIPSYKQ